MGLKYTIIDSVGGGGAWANGRHLLSIGNKHLRAGDYVWTDGKFIYGHEPYKQMPYIPVKKKDETDGYSAYYLYSLPHEKDLFADRALSSSSTRNNPNIQFGVSWGASMNLLSVAIPYYENGYYWVGWLTESLAKEHGVRCGYTNNIQLFEAEPNYSNFSNMLNTFF